jgi:hypothetical protein
MAPRHPPGFRVPEGWRLHSARLSFRQVMVETRKICDQRESQRLRREIQQLEAKRAMLIRDARRLRHVPDPAGQQRLAAAVATYLQQIGRFEQKFDALLKRAAASGKR